MGRVRCAPFSHKAPMVEIRRGKRSPTAARDGVDAGETGGAGRLGTAHHSENRGRAVGHSSHDDPSAAAGVALPLRRPARVAPATARAAACVPRAGSRRRLLSGTGDQMQTAGVAVRADAARSAAAQPRPTAWSRWGGENLRKLRLALLAADCSGLSVCGTISRGGMNRCVPVFSPCPSRPILRAGQDVPRCAAVCLDSTRQSGRLFGAGEVWRVSC